MGSLLTLASATPMVPYSTAPRITGPMVPNVAGGSFPPPPTCSDKLDFTQACNSQYVGIF